MKTKQIFYGLLGVFLCVGMFSCSNEDISEGGNPAVGEELIPVSFSVGFDQEITDFRSAEATKLFTLYYYVYKNETGDLYKFLTFMNFDGTINDALPEGNYTIVFVGSDDDYYFEEEHHLGYNIVTGTSGYGFRYPHFYIENGLFDGIDVFYKKMNCKVENEGQSGGSVTMDRIVGKIEIVVEDIVPEGVSKINIKTNFSRGYVYTLDADYTFPNSDRNPIGGSATFGISAGTEGFTKRIIAFEKFDIDQNKIPSSITLTAIKDHPAGTFEPDVIVATKTIDNVYVLRNKTVRYTGKLFDNVTPTPTDPSSSSSFSISLDDIWGETINKTF